jgi:hypothetical protein
VCVCNSLDKVGITELDGFLNCSGVLGLLLRMNCFQEHISLAIIGSLFPPVSRDSQCSTEGHSETLLSVEEHERWMRERGL